MWTGIAVLAAVLGWGIWRYNHLVRLQQRARQSWADIDAQLKRRHDLVPALVETVRGYAGHERSTLEEVVAQRAAAAAAARQRQAPEQRADSENQLAGALRRLFALAEAYPDLRASERFGMLQEQLAEIENHLQHARRYYNAVVRDFNIAQSTFPDLVVARSLGFQPRDFFQLESPLERRAVPVRLQQEA